MASPDHVGTPERAVPLVFGTPDQKDTPELPNAPSGWQKKVGSAKKGSGLGKKDVSFIAPDGEEIKSKRALDAYIKSHVGCPPASAFDWGTGETPTRRSSRLSSKPRPSLDSPQGGSAEKRRRKKVEDTPKHEEEGKVEDVPAGDVPPKTDADEVMLVVEKTESKSIVKDVPPLPVDSDGKELETEKEVVETASKAAAGATEGSQEVVENKAEAIETLQDANTDAEDGSGDKELPEGSQVVVEKKAEAIATLQDANTEAEDGLGGKEGEQQAQESSGFVLNEETNEGKESSEKLPDVFEQCPEAPATSAKAG